MRFCARKQAQKTEEQNGDGKVGRKEEKSTGLAYGCNLNFPISTHVDPIS